MKKHDFLFLFLCIVLLGCANINKRTDTISDIIPVDLEGKDPLTSVVEQIQIIPLQTDTNCLLRNPHYLSYNREIQKHLFEDKNIIYVYNPDGTLYSSSAKQLGEGPEQYLSLCDAAYNKYTKSIDILTTEDDIYVYTPDFKFISKKKLPETKPFRFAISFFPVDKDSYLIKPSTDGFSDFGFYLYNASKMSWTDSIYTPEEIVFGPLMDRKLCTEMNGKLYVSPHPFNNCLYSIDPDKKCLNADIKFDFKNKDIGLDEISRKFPVLKIKRFEIPAEDFGQVNDEYFAALNEIMNSSAYITSRQRLISSTHTFVLSQFDKTNSVASIYNRNTQKSYSNSSNQKFYIEYCSDLEENILTSLVSIENLDKHIDPVLLDTRSANLLALLKDDDNPVLVKYYLK